MCISLRNEKRKGGEIMNERFVVFRSNGDDLWYFHLKANNGKIIAQSEGYNTKRSALNGIASIKKNAAKAKIITR